MKEPNSRILTTHTGSLPRPHSLLEIINARAEGKDYNSDELASLIRASVNHVVEKQASNGIDIVSDGEFSKPSFATYVSDRIGGFNGSTSEPRIFADQLEFSEWSQSLIRKDTKLTPLTRPTCNAPLTWKDSSAVLKDISNLKGSLENVNVHSAFISSASLGIISEIMPNEYYENEMSYLYALSDIMKEEYRAITDAGLTLQIDSPDAAMGRHSQFWNKSTKEFRTALAQRIEALNHALEGLPKEQTRFHLCWGNYEGPHNYDIPLEDIIDLVLKVDVGAYSLEASNPRHAHEWSVWEQVDLPEGKTIIPGVIDSTSNFIEHPKVVCERILKYANIVGRNRIIAGTDCGFGTSAGASKVHPSIMWAKFRSMVDGARLATESLW